MCSWVKFSDYGSIPFIFASRRMRRDSGATDSTSPWLLQLGVKGVFAALTYLEIEG